MNIIDDLKLFRDQLDKDIEKAQNETTDPSKCGIERTAASAVKWALKLQREKLNSIIEECEVTEHE